MGWLFSNLWAEWSWCCHSPNALCMFVFVKISIPQPWKRYNSPGTVCQSNILQFQILWNVLYISRYINPPGHFLAATKQLYEWYFLSVRPSVCLSVCPSHLFDYVPIIVSSWNFQELLPVTEVTSMQKVKVRGQRSRSQRSQPNLAVSGL